MFAGIDNNLVKIEPGFEVDGLSRPSDFDKTAVSIGRILLGEYLEKYQESVGLYSKNTLYPLSEQSAKIESRFDDLTLPDDAKFRAFILRPTQPQSEFRIEGWYINLLSAAGYGRKYFGLETQVYLSHERGLSPTVGARKIVGDVFEVNSLAQYVEKRSQERRMRADHVGKKRRIDYFEAKR